MNFFSLEHTKIAECKNATTVHLLVISDEVEWVRKIVQKSGAKAKKKKKQNEISDYKLQIHKHTHTHTSVQRGKKCIKIKLMCEWEIKWKKPEQFFFSLHVGRS